MDFIPDKLEKAVEGAADQVKATAAYTNEILQILGRILSDVQDGRLEIRISVVHRDNLDLRTHNDMK